ncbi:MAG: S41 family peptidase [Anaerolineae bacterium]
METVYKFTRSLLIALFIFGLGIGVGYGASNVLRPYQPTEDESAAFGLYWEVWGLVQERFYGEIPNDTQSTYGAIRGALATLNDPYTIFVEPQPRALEKANLDGQFGGIGAFVLRDETGRVILDPMVDSPAERAGLLRGDILVKVDDAAIATGMSTEDVVLLIRGEVGTEVVLTVERGEAAELIEITIERAIIETPSVEWRLLEEDPAIGYIKISLFSARTSKELERALDDLTEQGAQQFILDLRDNGGGLLDSAIDVASQFLREGVILFEDRRGEEEKIYTARRGGKALDQTIAVLVNAGTASASEIVAGALRDNGRATLIGERTFGKGSVQLVYDLSDESSLHVTVAKWLTPDRHHIDGQGLSPDIEVLFSEDDHAAGRDPQFERAITFLQNGK